MNAKASASAPSVTLEVDDIQSGALHPRPVPYVGRLVLLRADDPRAGRALLRRLLPAIDGGLPSAKPDQNAWVAVAFTYQGLRALGVPQASLDSFPLAFRQGMAARAEEIGDTGESDPSHWEPPFGTPDVHIATSVLAPDEARLEKALGRARAALQEMHGAEVIWRQEVRQLPTRRTTLGFRDGINFPSIEGLGIPGSNPHEAPLKAGEFILGYPDETGNLPPMPQPEILRRNGTYLAVRKLHTNVAAWRQFLRANSATPKEEARLAAKMFGRWPSGAPLTLSPDQDDETLGADPHRNDDFQYREDDDRGFKCPAGAHPAGKPARCRHHRGDAAAPDHPPRHQLRPALAGRGPRGRRRRSHGCSPPSLRIGGGARDPLKDWTRKDTALAGTFSFQQPGVDRTCPGLKLVEVGQAAVAAQVAGRVDDGLHAQSAHLLPLYLDPSIMLTNAGAASPWRRVCRGVQTTSNTWNGVTSAGVTAGWLAEGTVSSDNTPTLGQLVITPQKEAQWIMASFEEVADSDISAQVPALIGDAFDRLEEAAFVTGTGSGQPFGAVTRATIDGSTGLVNAASAVSVFSLLSNLPVRFRVYDQAKPYWMANIAVINLLRALTAFASATTAVVNDNTDDGVPEISGYDLLESTTMDGSNAVGGHKNLLIFDANSYLICDRIGTTVIYEPLVPGAGGINPAGITGWFAYRRVGADTPTATALRVHNNA